MEAELSLAAQAFADSPGPTQAATVAIASQTQPDISQPVDVENPSQPTPKRRRRNAARSDNPPPKRGGKKRSLSKLVEMPLDILFEIFGHLHPLDLLHLARTTKAFRGVLMCRSAISVWKQAREHIYALPPCPSDLSEPEYANLVFDARCHFCLHARVLSIMWACRVRCCKNCLKYNFVDTHSLYASLPSVDVLAEVMIPAAGTPEKPLFMNSHVLELSQLITAVMDDEEKLKELEEERKEYVTELEENAEILGLWQETQTLNRSLELDKIRHSRRVAIMAKLESYGLAGDIALMNDDEFDEFLNQPFMKQPKALTDRIWNNIKESVISYVLDVRFERILQERTETLRARIPVFGKLFKVFGESHAMVEFLPSTADFCFMPIVREILELPQGAPIDDERFDHFVACLPQLCEEWKVTTSRKLLDLMPTLPADATPSGLSRLELATTWFKCAECPSPVGYPRVLVHPCITRSTTVTLNSDSAETDLLNALVLTSNQTTWNREGDKVAFSAQAAAIAREVVQLCGGDPDKMTAKQMDAMDARFVCTGCSSEQRHTYTTLSWRRAIHHLNVANHQQVGALVRLNEADTVVVRQHDEERIKRDHKYEKIWSCTRCEFGGSGGRYMFEVKNHLTELHEIALPLSEKEYYVRLEDQLKLCPSYGKRLTTPVFA